MVASQKIANKADHSVRPPDLSLRVSANNSMRINRLGILADSHPLATSSDGDVCMHRLWAGC